jgi:hypothetical protein
MYQGASVTFTYFYKGHDLDPKVLKEALQGVLAELPHLAGRGRILSGGDRLIDSVIECSNDGVEFSTADAQAIRHACLCASAESRSCWSSWWSDIVQA